ncbi:MAG: hypothetical protein Q7S29_05870 [Candidatus Peribacter sp.]|nr:hypothetical protein [Candidatus Peribacter sp.]
MNTRSLRSQWRLAQLLEMLDMKGTKLITALMLFLAFGQAFVPDITVASTVWLMLLSGAAILLAALFLPALLWKNENNVWMHWERRLLILLILCKCYSFAKAWGVAVGFDWSHHLEMLAIVSWLKPIVPAATAFYSYHPPLGFLIPRFFLGLGIPALQSVQLTSFVASLLAFFFLRASLRHLRILNQPAPVTFLYVLFSLPIQVSVARSINLDIIIFAIAAGILFFSIRTFWGKSTFTLLNVVALSLLLFAGAMTKFNGLLLFVIPPLVFLVSHHFGWQWKRVFITLLPCLIALAMIMPYYYFKNIRGEGELFPFTKAIGINLSCQDAARQKRDADPGAFFIALFATSPVHVLQGPEVRDQEFVRLADTWKDLWMSDAWIGVQKGASRIMSMLYFTIAPLLVISGIVAFLCAFGRAQLRQWNVFGLFVLLLAFIEIGMEIAFLYRYPCAKAVPSKAIYILPATMGLSFILASNSYLPLLSATTTPAAAVRFQFTMLLGVALLMLCNFMLPVY